MTGQNYPAASRATTATRRSRTSADAARPLQGGGYTADRSLATGRTARLTARLVNPGAAVDSECTRYQRLR